MEIQHQKESTKKKEKNSVKLGNNLKQQGPTRVKLGKAK